METQGRITAPLRATDGLSRSVNGIVSHWLAIVNLLLGVFVITPWLAPVFLQLGWEGAGRAIYAVYSLFCHQLPQRSWFLFGEQFTLPLAEIQRIGNLSNDMFELRRFIGNAEVGWKLAWSDRMVSFYGGWFLFGLVYALLRRRTHGLSWKTAGLLLLPMFIDGASHAISDLWGMGAGFRETNEWLVVLTRRSFPPAFYSGDASGSLNSIVRVSTGLLASVAVIFFVFPVIDRALYPERASAGS